MKTRKVFVNLKSLNTMSFYRKYRPQVFEELDNEAVRTQLYALLTKKRDSWPHAYLLSGPRGTGKTTTARILAKLFTCEKPKKSGEPCGTCDICVGVSKGTITDVLEIDAASNTGVDNIRDLRDKVMLAPTQTKTKFYIIDEVHMLSTGAFNALLKTLEEPPSHVVFVLATTDLHKVPATIQSRCLQLNFHKPTITEIKKALSRIISPEKISITEEAIEKIAILSDGSFRDAVKLLEQVSFTKGEITIDLVDKTLRVSDASLVEEFIKALQNRKTQEAIDIVERQMDSGTDMKAFLGAVIKKLHQQLLALTKAGKSYEIIQVLRLVDRLDTAFAAMKSTAIPQLPIEMAVIELCEEEEVVKSLSPLTQEAMKKPITHTEKKLEVKEKPKKPEEKKSEETAVVSVPQPVSDVQSRVTGFISLEKLIDCWKDVIEAMKPYNHSVAGVLRSTRPKAVESGIVTIEAFYSFHKDKLSEMKTRDAIGETLKKLFGEKVKVEVVLGKK